MKNHHNLQYQEFAISDKIQLSSDTFLFDLDGKIDFEPGQFVQISLDHYGEATFAICNDPERKDKFQICIRACGNTTNQLVKLIPGDKMKIRGPYGKGWPIHKMIGKDLVIIAGGIGLVPLRPLILNLIRYKKEFKKISIILGFKSENNIVFKDEILSWKEKFNDLKIYVEHGHSNNLTKIGLITEPLRDMNFKKNTIALICGPEIMFPYCWNILKEKGLSEENIFLSFERRMECGIGVCQHCNLGKYLVCEDGPVFPLNVIKDEIGK